MSQISQKEKINFIENNSVLSFEGVINRKWFLIHNFLTIYVPVLLTAILWFVVWRNFLGDVVKGEHDMYLGGYFVTFGLGILTLGLVPLIILVSVSLIIRRIRDIRASSENEWIWVGGVLILWLIPYVGILVVFFLYLKKGAVTSPESARPLEVSNPMSSIEFPSFGGNKSDVTSSLKDLAELYKDGSLTEVEFKEAKEKLLRKV